MATLNMLVVQASEQPESLARGWTQHISIDAHALCPQIQVQHSTPEVIDVAVMQLIGATPAAVLNPIATAATQSLIGNMPLKFNQALKLSFWRLVDIGA